MKPVITFLLLLITFSTLSAQEVNKSVKFEKKIHDFGKISETAGKVSYRFKFTNIGKDTVVMTFARSGCGCVTPSIPKNPVLPGKSDYVTVTFDPEYRPGKFSKEIAVISNGRKYNRIWINGEVIPGKHAIAENYRHNLGLDLYSSNRVLNFATVAPGKEKSMDLSLGNNSEKEMNLTFTLSRSHPEFSVIFPAKLSLKPGQAQKIPVRLKMLKEFSGEKKIKLFPHLNKKTINPIEITVKSK